MLAGLTGPWQPVATLILTRRVTEDPRFDVIANGELRDVLCRLRDLIDSTSVADITSNGPPHAAGAGQAH